MWTLIQAWLQIQNLGNLCSLLNSQSRFSTAGYIAICNNSYIIILSYLFVKV